MSLAACMDIISINDNIPIAGHSIIQMMKHVRDKWTAHLIVDRITIANFVVLLQ